MNKFFKFFMFFTVPLFMVMVSCDDDEVIEDAEPDITSVNPDEGAVGDQIVITGTDLEDVTTVSFGTVNATDFDATATNITVTVPAGAVAGEQDITVTSPGGSDTINFTVTEDAPALAITALDPPEGAPGDQIIITGTGLEDVTTVTVGETQVEAFAVEDDGTISFTVPDMDPAVTTVSISSPEGEADFDFEVVEATEDPAITSFTPMAGAVETVVTVSGTNLDQATSAAFGDVAIEDWEVNEEGTEATFTVPAGAVTGPFTLTTDAGVEVVSPDDFTVEEGPVITSFTPMAGPVETVVTVSGTDLDLATSAAFGDVAIEDWDVNEEGTEATFTVPAGAETGPFTLTTDAGVEVESADDFTVEGGEETAVLFDPMVGPVTTVVTVTGADFTDATAVRLGDTDVTDFTVEDDGSITFAVPEGATGGTLTVTTPAGDLVSANEFAVGTPNAVFEDAVSPEWQTLDGWDSENELDNTDLGDNTVKVVFSGAWGGFQFAPLNQEEPFDLTAGDQSVLISVYGGAGASDVMLYIKPSSLTGDQQVADADKVTLDVVEGEWKTFLVPVSDLGNPADIAELVVQNREAESNTIYIDDIMIVEP